MYSFIGNPAAHKMCDYTIGQAQKKIDESVIFNDFRPDFTQFCRFSNGFMHISETLPPKKSPHLGSKDQIVNW